MPRRSVYAKGDVKDDAPSWVGKRRRRVYRNKFDARGCLALLLSSACRSTFQIFSLHRSHARAPLLNQEKAIFHHIFHPVLVNLFPESAVDTELAVGGLEGKPSKFSSESDQPTLRRLRKPFDLHPKIASTPHRLHKCEPQIDERALRAENFQSWN